MSTWFNMNDQGSYVSMIAGANERDDREVVRFSADPSQPGVSFMGGAGIVVPSTYTGNALDLSGVFQGHAFYYHGTSLASGKRVIRIGDWGSEIAMAAGQGLVRSYGKVTSGTDDTAVHFHWAFTTSTGGLFVEQLQAESQADTPGPKTVEACSFFAGLADGKYLAASSGVTDGLIATWHKVYGSVGSVCNGDVVALWVDNQMSCAVGGTEASIRGTTGGTVPDGFVWLNTTSGGWASLFYFDSTMASKPPLSTHAPQTQANNADGGIIININSTLYYVPYFAVGKCS